MNTTPAPLRVYEAGTTTVIGFGGEDVFDEVNLAACREEIVKLIDANACKTLGVDLTGVRLVPSGLLGMLTSIRRRGVEVQIYNPSKDVREVLSVTNLDKLMPVHEVEIDRTNAR